MKFSVQKILTIAAMIGFSMASIAQNATAQDREKLVTKEISGSVITLGVAEMKTIELGSVRQIRKIYVQAEGIGGEAEFEVIVNGEVKGTVSPPGRDPNYVVTIAEATRSLSLRHRSGRAIKISSITAEMSPYEVQDTFGGYLGLSGGGGEFSTGRALELPSSNEAASIALLVIRMMDDLQDNTRWADFGEYLLPIKKVAGRAYAISSVRGLLSNKVREAMIALVQQIAMANEYIEAELERKSAFPKMIQLMTLKERILRALE